MGWFFLGRFVPFIEVHFTSHQNTGCSNYKAVVNRDQPGMAQSSTFGHFFGLQRFLCLCPFVFLSSQVLVKNVESDATAKLAVLKDLASRIDKRRAYEHARKSLKAFVEVYRHLVSL